MARLEDEAPTKRPVSTSRDPVAGEPTVVYLPDETDEATSGRQAEFESKLGQMLGGWLLPDDEQAAG